MAIYLQNERKFMRFLLRICAVILLMVLSCGAFAQEVQIPDADIGSGPDKLVTNNKEAKPAVTETPQNLLPKAPVRDATIVVFGDSLMSGFGIGKYDAVPALLEQQLRVKNYKNVRIYNESKAGETSYNGLRRLEDALRHKPDVVVLELGINDVKEKRSVQSIYQSLDIIIKKLQEKKVKVILLGMEVPIEVAKAKMTKSEIESYKLRKEYSEKFAGMYAYLAKQYSIPLYPYVMKGLFADKKLLNADGVHPSQQGAKIIAQNIMPVLEPVVYGVVHKK